MLGFKERYIAVILLALCMLLSGAGAAYSKDLITVKAEGTHEVSELTSEIKRLALDDAMRKAVKKALATFMTEDSIEFYSGIFESTIFANMEDYILNYRITAEGTINHMDSHPEERGPEGAPNVLKLYHIWIEATIDLKRLKRDVKSMTTIGEDEVSEITLIVLGIKDFDTFSRLKGAIESMDKVRDLSYNSFYQGRMILAAQVAAKPEIFWEELSSLLGEDYVVIPGGGDRIIIKASERK